MSQKHFDKPHKCTEATCQQIIITKSAHCKQHHTEAMNRHLNNPHKCSTAGCQVVITTKMTRCSIHKREYDLRIKYGINQDQYNEMFISQDRHCAICPATEPGGKGQWHVDHDHKTGIVRGILCHNCNLLLGQARDNISILLAAVVYLNKYIVGK